MGWLPEGFEHPARLDLASGHHLRPIRADDIDLDYPAVMGSRPRLWELYGDAWGWPPATMTVEQDRAELVWHADEMVNGRSFNYAIFDDAESELLGCVYIDPPGAADEAAEVVGAVVSWWVVDHAVGTQLDVALGDGIPRWLAEEWPFSEVRYGV